MRATYLGTGLRQPKVLILAEETIFMPLFGIDTAMLLVVQAPISAFVYHEAKRYPILPPLLVGSSVLILGICLAFILNTFIGVVTVELFIIFIYRLRVYDAR